MIVRAALVAAVACASVAAGQQAAPQQDQPRPAAKEREQPRRGGADADRSAGAGGDRRGEGMRWRPDSPMPQEMMDRVIAVARDVSPDLARQLEERRNRSPDEMSQAMRQSARRLVALAVLKERNPDIYAIRVEDLRLQLELRALGDQYRAAVESKATAKAAELEAQIAAKVRSQVDVDMRARAQELVALDEQMKAMRQELLDEQQRTDQRVAERVDAVKNGQPIQERGIFGEGGPGERRGRARPEGDRPADPAAPASPAARAPGAARAQPAAAPPR